MFEHLMKQELKLVKKDHSVVEGIKASVQERIYINDIKLSVEEGDVFEYTLPSGVKQKLLVTKVILYNVELPLDHYEIEYVKD